jgi:hypothetical protein
MVYSYSSGSWEEQAGVEVVALDPPDAEEGHEVIEDGDAAGISRATAGGDGERAHLRSLPSVISWWAHAPWMAGASDGGQRTQAEAGGPTALESTADSIHAVDTDGDGYVDEDEFRAYLAANRAVRYGACRVRICGVELRYKGSAKAYKGVNGEYEMTEEVLNGRAVYAKVDRPTTAMWWTNNDGKISWCVGPREEVGKTGMWAYVESMGFGPEEAGRRPWMVYSYNSGSWEEQAGVEVVALDPPDAEGAQEEGAENQGRQLGSEQGADSSVAMSSVEVAPQTPRAPLLEWDLSSAWLFGVGLQVSANLDGAYVVRDLVPLSPAEECGLIQVLLLSATRLRASLPGRPM